MTTVQRHQITVEPDAIEPGDRTTRDGKTRYVLKHHHRGNVYWRTQTRGARSANVVTYTPEQKVVIWRPTPTPAPYPPATETDQPAMSLSTGTNPDRQAAGLPGHCDDCGVAGHVTAHPNLGCSDVGCSSAHDDFDAPIDWSQYLDDLAKAGTVRQVRLDRSSGANLVYSWVDDDSPATEDDIAAEHQNAANRVAHALQAFSAALGNAYAPNLTPALHAKIFAAASNTADAEGARNPWSTIPFAYAVHADLANQAHAEGSRLAVAPLTDAEWSGIETAHKTLARRTNDSGSPLCEAIENVITNRGTASRR